MKLTKTCGVILTAGTIATLFIGCGGGLSNSGMEGTTWATNCESQYQNNGTSSPTTVINTRKELKFTDKQLTYSLVTFADPDSKTKCKNEASRSSWVYDYTVGDDLGSKIGGQDRAKKVDLTLQKIELNHQKKAVNSLTELDKKYSTSYLRQVGLFQSFDSKSSNPTYSSNSCSDAKITLDTPTDVLTDASLTPTNCTIISQGGLAGDYLDQDSREPKRLQAGTKIYQIMALDDVKGAKDDISVLYLGYNRNDHTNGFSEETRPMDIFSGEFFKKLQQ